MSTPQTLTQPALFPSPTIPVDDGPVLAEIPISVFPGQLPGPKPAREFRASVLRYGVVVPVILEEDPGGAIAALGMRLSLIDGNRRVMAAREAGLASVTARVFGRTEFAPQLTLALNGLRSANPVTEYDAIRELVAEGLSESEICRATGVPVARMRARMQLAKLLPALFVALSRQEITQSVAEAAAKLPVALQSELARKLAESGKLTAEDVRSIRQVDVAAAVASLPGDIFEPEEAVAAHWTDRALEMLESTLRVAPSTAEAREFRVAVGAALDVLRRVPRP